MAADGETGRGQDKQTVVYVVYGRSVVSAQIMEVSLFGVGTVLRLERDARSMVKLLRRATNEYAAPAHFPPLHSPSPP